MRCEFCQKTINDGVCANLECSGRQAKKEKLKEGYERLNKMRADGDITVEEFNRQAREIMLEVQREKNKNPESGGQ